MRQNDKLLVLGSYSQRSDGRPLLVLDMYEHAYHMDYGAAAAKYVDAFLQNLNWEEVNRRTEALAKA
jgi:superoxide dismutase